MADPTPGMMISFRPTPLMLLLVLTFGFPLIFTSFSLTHTVLVAALVTALAWMWRPRGWSRIEVATWYLCIGAMLLWLSLLFSYRDLDSLSWNGEDRPIGVGGFPIVALRYPFPPMGGNAPPSGMWPVYFADALIWYLAGAGIVYVLAKRFPRLKDAAPVAGVIGVVATLLTLGYIGWLFD